MNSTWKYYDIMDLEYFFQQDSEMAGEELHERDRQILLDEGGATLKDQPAPSLLALWLAARRKKHGGDPQPLPGALFQEAHSLLCLLLIFFGLMSGAGVGLAFFSYSGATPVNVLHFLVLFVFSQLILAALLFARAGLIQLGLRAIPHSLIIRALGTFALGLIVRLSRRTTSHLSGEKRLAAEANIGRMRSAAAIYPSLFFWPLFTIIQLASICFNLGLLAATFFKITVSDIAFGWQSTLQFSTQSLHSFISWMALPWSWLLPEGTGYPTLAEIEGSHIILKEGISSLQTPDLISWWPFLLLSVVFYGLLLRLLLLGMGLQKERRIYNHPIFSSLAARQVLRRMQTPTVSSQALPETTPQTAGKMTPHSPATSDHATDITLEPVIALLPDEIFDSCQPETLARIMASEGFRITQSHRFMIDYDSDQQLLARLAAEQVEQAVAIVIIMEAWMPPLVSFQSFVREMRSRIGKLPIMLRLVGKPDAENALTLVTDPSQSRIWREKMAALGDPQLTTRELIHERTS
ncbi:DUF2868 domain-containing protein [Desulfopila aestuarii]|uniref:DUF2868 domain-containing protein n=1 Tax=Desulfopila aestuarii DSM 18488 TaxID=1121416 RepID=A0A1M7Y5Y2_9BACT|nr:DUF2868 domain-containing protein [Desulfopila aestuarii]SHO47904.1 Protein of unknown function [Desulfopila aestuarii DSM 18488]